ncbi:DUF928 domain-containing protein [Roseofilum reptotaenium CS-1145]|uniref:DUF928 domain-containing protein n=1 Tax=Roseofilum reptotaenium AO1-A TaxID=1925591 RepID=A0A1L9QRF8_9CYAN|nr:DUF928 domain-containing protein [Roseofilum reptotaenium]MDB9519851.1 DUF928 domain-containing protein [Roseofilum reptotaenium CS-1145]OJJ25229.1 hypothetical protein BI308_12860 [Roseofilum reptotaenium AO1-A]
MKKNTFLSGTTRKLATLTFLAILGWHSGSTALPKPSFEIAQAFNPPRRGAPPRTSDAGTRGCSVSEGNNQPLTALVPVKDLALTLESHPTLFWYVPHAEGKMLKFTLMDKNDTTIIYEKALPAPSESGIVSIRLSKEEAEGLKNNELYHWYLSLVCDPQDRTGDIIVDGWIERIEASDPLKAQIQQASPEALPKIYAESGIWHDALSAMAQLYDRHPQDGAIANQWETLLRSVQLDAFAQSQLLSSSESE